MESMTGPKVAKFCSRVEAHDASLLIPAISLLYTAFQLAQAAQQEQLGREWYLWKTQGYENAVVFVLLTTGGLLYPILNAALLLPGRRHVALLGRQVPVWALWGASVPFGAAMLLPYLATHGPLPPLPRERSRRRWTTATLPGVAVLLAGGLWAVALCFSDRFTWGPALSMAAGGSAYVHLRAVNVVLLTLMAPFIVLRDAQRRRSELLRRPWWAVLVAVPVFGPAAYLVLC